jgi:hypothetical protein
MTAEAARLEIEDAEAQRLNPEDVDGPSAPRMRLNNLDRLVNWSNEFLAMGDSAADRDTENENSKGGQPLRH